MYSNSQAPTKAKKAIKSIDFNDEMQFQSNSIKTHTLAHATANTLGKPVRAEFHSVPQTLHSTIK